MKSCEPGMEKQHKCRECMVTFKDIQDYVHHLESREHVKGIMKNKYGQKYLEAKEKLREEKTNSITDSKGYETKVQTKEDVKKPLDSSSSSEVQDDEDDVYPCEVCQKVCTGYISYRLHLEGKKHKKMLSKQNLIKKLEDDLVITPGPENGLMQRLMPQQLSYKCDLCNKTCSGPEVYRQHCRSVAHLKKIALQDIKKDMGEDGEVEDGPRFCEVCEKSFSGLLPYIQHMESETHLRQSNKSKDTKVKCDECGKNYSTVAHLQAHLKSGSHGRQQRKHALMQELEQSQPNMVVKDGLLGCELCHSVFSGPEAAHEHFESDRHQKALQRKKQFRKFRTALPKEDDDSDEFDIISEP